jgi:CRISPR-associated protein Csm1
LLWSVTENLGDWTRGAQAAERRVAAQAGHSPGGRGAQAFQPFASAVPADVDAYFSKELGLNVREAIVIGWSPETPAMVHPGAGKLTWNVTPNLSLEGITLARHAAPSEDGRSAATVATLARRAQGRSLWGVLRGDVDSFGVRLRRLTTIEEHVQLSVLYKQFFAGELEVLCSMPEFWRKVTILYSGGDDFAVYGSWDALLLLAREVQRLFHRFTEENLKDFPGPEGKTISMAVALAPEMHYPINAVYQDAGRNLELAKAADKDCIYVLGRILEWKQLADAADPERYRGEAGRRLPDVAPAPDGAAQLLSEAGIRRGRGGRRPHAHLALSAPPDANSERHARPRIPETADAFDQRNRGTQVGRSEAAARRAGGPGVGQIDD